MSSKTKLNGKTGLVIVLEMNETVRDGKFGVL